jgi:hypothetical protein
MLHPYGPLPTRTTCGACKGSGVDHETDLLCRRCDGSGEQRKAPEPVTVRQVADALGGGLLIGLVFFIGWSAMVFA